jgi:T4-like virus Myoviridae tail sheath stabiliser
MIGGTPFYHSLFKKYVVIFGTLFKNISIERQDASGNLEQTFMVPISYGPREKFLARVTGNPEAIAQTAIKLPRMSFTVSNITYAPDRKLPTINKIASKQNINGVNNYKKVFNPVPYDIGFKLEIMSKTMEDGLRILEQILPYFTPEWTVTAQLLANDFNNLTDIPVVLNTVSIEDEYEADFITRKVLVFELNFTMKCYFYGPVTESKIIKFTTVNLYSDLDANSAISSIYERPGLTANGQPTTSVSDSVPVSMIDETDNYGFIIDIVDRGDG